MENLEQYPFHLSILLQDILVTHRSTKIVRYLRDFGAVITISH